MVNDLFTSILNMSFITSFVILFVLIIRLFLKKAPKVFSYVLWAVVLFRLLSPFTFESPVGVLRSSSDIAPTVIENRVHQETEFNISSNDYITNNNVPTVITTTNVNKSPIEVGFYIWIIGVRGRTFRPLPGSGGGIVHAGPPDLGTRPASAAQLNQHPGI